MQKSVIQAIESLCGEKEGIREGSTLRSRLPSSVVKSVLFFADHIPNSFPAPTPTLYPPDKLVLEWWCGVSSCVRIVFQDKEPVTYEIKTPKHHSSGKMMPPAEFAEILNSVLQENSSH